MDTATLEHFPTASLRPDEVPHSSDTLPRHFEVVIAGAGFAGLGMAKALLQAGSQNFLVLERADEIGGTWRDNTYPGCACDIPSVLYSWTDEPNPRWSRAFAGQPEILDYMRAVADRRGLRRHVRVGSELLAAQWQGDRWIIETSTGTITADILISAVGALSEPSIPQLPGIERFRGRVFHSARWAHDHDLTDRDVAVVGTGASAVQFVPEIQPKVGHLHLFQRTPPWILPRENTHIPERWQRRFGRFPRLQRLIRTVVFSVLETFHTGFKHPRLMRGAERRALAHLERQVPDPQLRARLTPSYGLGCKRVLGSNTWYPTLASPNVDVVTTGIRELVEDGIVDRDGVLHRVDTIIFGTGFHVTDMPIIDRVFSADGETLADKWQGSMKAHLGLAATGFPNFFMLLGPNSGLGHNSVLLMIEAQVKYLMQALAFRRDAGKAVLEAHPDAQARFIEEIDAGTRGSVWTTGGCSSWYLDETGRNSTLWPGSVRAYKRRVGRFDPADFKVTVPRKLPTREPAIAA